MKSFLLNKSGSYNWDKSIPLEYIIASLTYGAVFEEILLRLSIPTKSINVPAVETCIVWSYWVGNEYVKI